jgi:hypothetical protein
MKRIKQIKLLLLFFILLLFFKPVGGTDHSVDRAFSDSLYKEIKKERVYSNYLEKKKETKNFFSQLREYFFQWLSRLFGSKAARVILGILPYALVIIAVVLILLRITSVEMSKIFKPETRKAGEDVVVSDENIHELDLDNLLRNAEEKSDFRLAIRYWYLKVLRLLSANNLINWQIHKSNYDYLREIPKTSYYPVFKELTRDFEYLWYGEFSAGKEYYENASAKAQELINEIRNSGNKQT